MLCFYFVPMNEKVQPKFRVEAKIYLFILLLVVVKFYASILPSISQNARLESIWNSQKLIYDEFQQDAWKVV